MDKLSKTLIYATIGSSLEWYDFAIFGLLSPTLSRLFFPTQDPMTSLMITFSIFAIGFFMRPFGGILFGHIGDRYGRKRAILISVFLMTLATVGIGLLPIHYSPTMMVTLLLLLRLFQGVSVGGEFPGIVTFGGELGAGGNFFFYLCVATMATYAGVLLGVIVSAFFLQFHNDYAWRFPFLFGIILGVIGFYLRTKASESPLFSDLKQQKKLHRLPILESLKQYKRIIWLTIMLASSSVAFYFVSIYYPDFVAEYSRSPKVDYLVFSIVPLSLAVIIVPLIGIVANKRNFTYIITVCHIGLLLLPVPTLYLVVKHSSMITVVMMQTLSAIFCAPLVLFMASAFYSFPTNIRYTSMAIILGLVTSIFGGTYPLVSTLLVKETGVSFAAGIYLSLLIFISMILFFYHRKFILANVLD